MTLLQRFRNIKLIRREWASKIGRWSGRRKGRSSKVDKASSKSEREWAW